LLSSCFFCIVPLPPPSTLFPYTTLFRSPLQPRLPAPVRVDGPARPPLGRHPARGPRPPHRARRLPVRRHRAGRRTRHHRLGCRRDRKSTRLNSSHVSISYAVFCLKKKKR